MTFYCPTQLWEQMSGQDHSLIRAVSGLIAGMVSISSAPYTTNGFITMTIKDGKTIMFKVGAFDCESEGAAQEEGML
jgi:ammonia channel protein AmtB